MSSRPTILHWFVVPRLLEKNVFYVLENKKGEVRYTSVDEQEIDM
jgi:hypothetical protein